MFGFVEDVGDVVVEFGEFVGDEAGEAASLEFAPNPEQLKMALKGIKVAAPGIL